MRVGCEAVKILIQTFSDGSIGCIMSGRTTGKHRNLWCVHNCPIKQIHLQLCDDSGHILSKRVDSMKLRCRQSPHTCSSGLLNPRETWAYWKESSDWQLNCLEGLEYLTH